MINSVLVSPEGEEFVCKYFEINEVCKKIIQNLCNNDVEIKKKFFEFKKEYTYFEPYFDFVLFELGYVIKNPFDIEKAEMFANNNDIYMNYNFQCIAIFGKSNDSEIGLCKLNEENMDISMIDGNLMAIKPKNYKKHLFIARFILNHIFIKNQKIYEEYLEETTPCLFYNFEYDRFLISHFSFFSLDKNVKNEKQSQFAVFRNQEYYYTIYAEEKTVTPIQKEFIDKLIVKKIINPYFVAIMPSNEGRKQV